MDLLMDSKKGTVENIIGIREFHVAVVEKEQEGYWTNCIISY